MSTRADALASQQGTGKITASIIPIAAGCHPARAITTCEAGNRSNSRMSLGRSACGATLCCQRACSNRMTDTPERLTIGIVRLHYASDKGGDQRSQFGKRRNIHQQSDIAADFLLANLKLDMQKQHQV